MTEKSEVPPFRKDKRKKQMYSDREVWRPTLLEKTKERKKCTVTEKSEVPPFRKDKRKKEMYSDREVWSPTF